MIGASELGLELADMLAVVLALSPEDFYKSMTTHAPDGHPNSPTHGHLKLPHLS